MLSATLLAHVLAIAAAAPTPQTLDDYMAALATIVARRQRVAELAAQERTGEIETLIAEEPPTVLGSDWPQSSGGLPNRKRGESGDFLYRVGQFCLDQGVPEAATPLLDEAVRRGVKLDSWVAQRVFKDLITLGLTDAARVWSEAHPIPEKPGNRSTRSVKSTGWVEAFTQRLQGATGPIRARIALLIWRLPLSPSVTKAHKLTLLTSALPTEGRRLAFEATLRLPSLSRADRSRILESLAQQAPVEEQYVAWKRVVDARLSPAQVGRALIQMAELRMKGRKPRDALRLLYRARDASAETAPWAQWQIALTHVSMGDYASALWAFRRSELELPRLVCCGEGPSDDYAFWTGLCREHLGQIDGAISDYVAALFDPRVAAHLIDLYEMAGQFADVERILVERTPTSVGAYETAVPALTLLVLRRIARAQDWRSLVAVLRDPALPNRRGDRSDGPRGLYATETVRLLARDCESAVPLLVASLPVGGSATMPWITHALGRCGTSAAVSTLRESARDDRRAGAWEAREALKDSENGRAALRAMGLPDQPTAVAVRLGLAPFPFPFPGAGPSTRLPKDPVAADRAPRPYRGPNNSCACW